jgi:hypothetical protein
LFVRHQPTLPVLTLIAGFFEDEDENDDNEKEE